MEIHLHLAVGRVIATSHLCARYAGSRTILCCGSAGKLAFVFLAKNRGINGNRISSFLCLQPLCVRIDSEEIAVLQLRQRIGYCVGDLSVCINHKRSRDFIHRLLLIICH